MGNVVLGKMYHDVITGFEGTATVRYDLIGGRILYKLSRPVSEDGKLLSQQFDVSQLRDTKDNEVTAPKLPKQDIKFGEEYMDRISGLRGRATQRSQHVDGCIQWAIDPPVNEKGELLPGYFFDDARILDPKTLAAVERTPAGKGSDQDDDYDISMPVASS